LSDNIYQTYIENQEFYKMTYIYFNDLFSSIFAIMIAMMLVDINKKAVIGITYAAAAFTLLFTSGSI